MATAEKWRDAFVAQLCTELARLRSASVLETAQSIRETLAGLRGIALVVGDRELDESIGQGIKEADAICGRLAAAGRRAWRRR